MDNFRFTMICDGTDRLKDAFSLAWRATGNDRANGGATCYAIRPALAAVCDPEKPYLERPGKPERMVFFWGNAAEGTDKVRLPFRMDAAGAADFATRWLAEADYGPHPDHDGDSKRGWHLYNESWGRVDDDFCAIIAVAPSWSLYGK